MKKRVEVCQLAKLAGADFVKTSTGFSGGATIEDIELMREAVGPIMGSQGIWWSTRTLEAAKAFIKKLVQACIALRQEGHYEKGQESHDSY